MSADQPTPLSDALSRLDGLKLPLLPIGAGDDKKGPVNSRTGKGLTGWPTCSPYTVPQLRRLNGHVVGVGVRTGPEAGLLVFDFDSPAARELALAHGCDPAAAVTWQVHRTTGDLPKIIFRFDSDIEHQDSKLDGLEVFFNHSRQVILAGAHPKSGGHYFWPPDRGPEALAEVPDAWLELAMDIWSKAPQTDAEAVARTIGTDWSCSSASDPCPVCGRDHSGGCSIHVDGRSVWCLQGQTCSPPLGLAVGKTIVRSGVKWAFIKQAHHDCFGTRSYFKIHEPFQQPPKPPRFQPRPGSTARWGKRRLGHDQRMRCLERCIVVQAKRERNAIRRRARLLKVCSDLDLSKYINRQEIAQRVLEAKSCADGSVYKVITAAERAVMPRPVVTWLMPGLVPANDMTIIGGRPKVGKTRLAVAIVAALLAGEAILDVPAPAAPAPVVLITDDQSDGDTADMLTALDIWTHDNLLWSRNFRLTEEQIDALLVTVKEHPGALVVLDSLRSIGRAMQYGENDPEIGAILYDLKQAVIDGGGTLVLIHHCNKTMDLVGVEALSGHSAIAGAANTVLTMHYLPGPNNQPNKAIPERRLVREGRSGDGFDMVITRNANSFRHVASMDKWQQDSQTAAKLQKLIPLQQQVKDTLDADPARWMTRREVCDALDLPWGDRGRNQDARRVGDALARLVELKAAESVRTGIEASFRSASGGEGGGVAPPDIPDNRATQ